MRRKVFGIVLVFALCTILVSLAGCDKHTHKFSEWVTTKEATCTEEGLKSRSCEGCEVIQQEAIPALNHSLTWEEIIMATCTEDGVKAHYECSRCHKNFDASKEEITDIVISATGHKFGGLIAEVRATCTVDGVKAHYECSDCHKYFDASMTELTDIVIPATGHKYGELITEVKVTCTVDGVKAHYECSDCHKYFDANKEEIADIVIPATGHKYGELIAEVKATCTIEGTKTHYECSGCHKYFDEEYNELTDISIPTHSLHFVKGEAATCTEDGTVDAYRCAICRQLFDENRNVITDTVIPATGHNFTALIPEVSATETANGVKEHKDCQTCGLHFDADDNEILDIVIPATVHTLTWIESVAATCTEDGVKAHYECSHCELYFDEEYKTLDDITIPAAHHYQYFKHVEPTCDKEGNIALYVCTECGYMVDTNKEELAEGQNPILPKINHIFGEWIAEVSATCTANGVKAHKTCTMCHNYFDEDDKLIEDILISAKHTFVHHAEVSATCTENGVEAYNYCSVCDKNFNVFGNEITNLDDLVILAKGHRYSKWVESVVTCTSAGIVGHYHCDRCNMDYDENHQVIENTVVRPSGHNYTTEEIIPTVSATCTTDGAVAHFECSKCGMCFDSSGAVIDNIVLEKTGHSIGSHYDTVFPTCTEPGHNSAYICAVCGDYFSTIDKTVSISEEELFEPAAGHNYQHIDKVEATCFSGGMEEHYYCSKCYKYFNMQKEEINRDDLEIAIKTHKLGELILGRAATETEDGIKDHYQCEYCLSYFDKDETYVNTIIVPKTVHSFGPWVSEVSATCTVDGVKGHFECSHCNKYFDIDSQEILDLTIPAAHLLSDLIPVSQVKCYGFDVVIAHYRCLKCDAFIGEDGSELSYNDVYAEANHHHYEISDTDYWDHIYSCVDCRTVKHEDHVKEMHYYDNDNGEYKMNWVCTICHYESEKESYRPVKDIIKIADIYVGYPSSLNAFLVTFKDGGNYNLATLEQLLSSSEAERYYELINGLGKDFVPFTETFTLNLFNYTTEMEVTIRPYIVYGVIASPCYYQQEHISNISQLMLIYDSNYYRESKIEYYLDNANIVDVGDFDPDFDFAAYGSNTKEFTLKYQDSFTEQTYDVKIVLTTDKVVTDFEATRYLVVGGKLMIDVYYSNDESATIEVSADMIVEGTFDAASLEWQILTINYGGITKKIFFRLMDPHEASRIYLYTSAINVGETLKLYVDYVNGDSTIIDVTPEMITMGSFDNMVAGRYEICIKYQGKTLYSDVVVVDPNDRSPYYFDLVMEGNSLVWDIKDGKVVVDVSYLYIYVVRNNNERDYIKVTENMLFYDETAVNKAIETNGTFILTISYYGKSKEVIVAPRELDTLTVQSLRVYKKANLGNYFDKYNPICLGDGDTSEYFVCVRTEEGTYFVALTKEFFYVAQDGDNENLVPFDFENASSKIYETILCYKGVQYDTTYLLIYAKDEVRYYLSSAYVEYGLVVGTREEVLAQIKDFVLSLQMNVSGHSFWVKDIKFSDLVIGLNEDVDFTKPGRTSIKVSYEGIVDELEIILIPNVSGVEKRVYNYIIEDHEPEEIILYADGNVYASYQMQWGSWVLINETLKLYQVTLLYDTYFYQAINDEEVILFKAEMLEDNLEEYTFNAGYSDLKVKIYTKNGTSLADFYDMDGDYYKTVLITFSEDGTHLEFEGNLYLITEDNVLSFETQGEVIYTVYSWEEYEYMKLTFNDNGKVYVYRGIEIPGGLGEEYIMAESFEWCLDGEIVKITYEGSVVATGILMDGRIILDLDFE